MEEKDVQRLLDMLFGMIDEAKSVAFSSDKCVINRDEALDLLDEACSAVRIEAAERPGGPEKPAVTAAHIAAVVSRQSGVPAEKLTAVQTATLAAMEQTLSGRVVGQPDAVRAVAGALQRARLGLASTARPMGAFLFLGPTGVGKTALARALADCCFGSEKALLRFDMSEYMEKHTVARLLGAPPGYVGYGEGGQLTEAVRRRPYSVVLLDEIEKTHPDVANILLQIMEDGALTDSEGRRVDFTHTLVILTSNLGAKHLAGQRAALGFVRLGVRGLPRREPLMLAREPRALLFHDPADLFLRRAIRRANDEPPVFIEPQPDGPPVCADDGIAFHQYHAHPNRRILMSHCPTV